MWAQDVKHGVRSIWGLPRARKLEDGWVAIIRRKEEGEGKRRRKGMEKGGGFRSEWKEDEKVWMRGKEGC